MIKLYKGNCLEIMSQFPNESVDMILCDLPYGTTNADWDNVIPIDLMWKQFNRIIKKGGAIVLFGSQPFSALLICSNFKNFKYEWVWNKRLAGNGLLAKKQPLKIHENKLVFNSDHYYPLMSKGKKRKKMTGGLNSQISEMLHKSKSVSKEYENDLYYPKSIIEFSTAKMRGKRLHSAQKPVDLLEYLIMTYTHEGETVLDSCMGSGSTGVACKHTKRNFIGIELNNCFFEIAEKRIDNSLMTEILVQNAS